MLPSFPANVSLVTTSHFDALNDLPDGFDGPDRFVHVIGQTVFVDDRVGDDAWDRYFVGVLDGAGWWGIDVPADADDPSYGASTDLRRSYDLVPEAEWLLAGRALQTVEWARTHRF